MCDVEWGVEEGSLLDKVLSKMINNSECLFIKEHQTNKRFRDSPVMTYRIDKGDGTPGQQTHVHVFMKGRHPFAINMDGITNDGAK